MTFKDLAKLGAEQLAKQGPFTLEKARAQFLCVRYKELFIKRFSKISNRNDAKKNAAEFLKDMTNEDYKALQLEFDVLLKLSK